MREIKINETALAALVLAVPYYGSLTALSAFDVPLLNRIDDLVEEIKGEPEYAGIDSIAAISDALTELGYPPLDD